MSKRVVTCVKKRSFLSKRGCYVCEKKNFLIKKVTCVKKRGHFCQKEGIICVSKKGHFNQKRSVFVKKGSCQKRKGHFCQKGGRCVKKRIHLSRKGSLEDDFFRRRFLTKSDFYDFFK